MKKRKKKSNLKRAITMFIILVLLWIFAFYIYVTYSNIEINTSNYTTQKLLSTGNEQTVEEAQEKSKNVADILEETTQCVVGISKLKSAGTSILTNTSEAELGLGTGFFVTDNGYILSNEHVTGSKYSKCYITTEAGDNYDGTVVWSDSDLDLSITKINIKNAKCVTLGNSKNIRVGESVYAIGNPIGFEFRRTVTSGIISAKNRTIKIDDTTYMSDLVQTDATINPGNSGGPLIYPNGEVVAINTVKISSAEGIGFAIPINVVKPIIDSFKNTDGFEETSMGIYAYDKEVVPYLGQTSRINFSKGIYVIQITPNSPADGSGLKENDVITSIDGVEINTMNELREYIYGKKPGDEVRLNVLRGKINKTIIVTLGKGK